MRIIRGEVQYDPLRFGFVAEDGKVYGLVSAEVRAKRVDMMPLANHIVATDIRGKTYEFTGAAITGHPHYNFNPCHTCFQSLFRYQHGSHVGYGEMGDIFGLEYLAEHLATTGEQRWTPVPVTGTPTSARHHFGEADHPTAEGASSSCAARSGRAQIDAVLTRKMQRHPAPPFARPALSDLADCVRSYLRTEIEGECTVSGLCYFTGGVSKVQLGFTLDWTTPDGEPRTERLVVRMDPKEGSNATSRRREFELIRALDGTVPVPRPFGLDPDGEFFRSPPSSIHMPPDSRNPAPPRPERFPAWEPISARCGVADSLRSSWSTWPGSTPSISRRRTFRAWLFHGPGRRTARPGW